MILSFMCYRNQTQILIYLIRYFWKEFVYKGSKINLSMKVYLSKIWVADSSVFRKNMCPRFYYYVVLYGYKYFAEPITIQGILEVI